MSIIKASGNYLRGLGNLVILLIVGILLLLLYFTYQSIYLIVIGLLLILTVIIIPYFLGKKPATKPGRYSLKKVR